ncbi:hypothetical protein ATCC90586_004187 [Pythium insidiosum]|nr:hypothetical protein ATCC90586_004187 [Pythium insidiosum]
MLGAVDAAARRRLQRVRAAMDAFTAQLQCAICLCAYDKPMSLPCNHCFCEECIHRALELKPVCPICKAPAKKRRLRYDTMIQQLLGAAETWTRHTPSAPDAEPTGGAAVAAAAATATTPIRINPRIVEHAGDTGSAQRQSKKRKAAAAATDTATATASATRRRLETETVDENESKPTEPPAAAAVATSTATSTATATATSTATVTGNGVHAAAPSERFVVGQLVDVIDRTWRGVNKPGGAAWVTAAHADGSYDVRYIIGTRREQRVPEMYVLLPKEEIVSFATPGTSVKQHRRKPRNSSNSNSNSTNANSSSSSQSALASHALLASPPSHPSAAPGERAVGRELVLAFSGFQEVDMPQLERWAAAIGAQIATHWSPFVTHVLAKCATPQEIADSAAADHHADDAASASAASGAQRKRALFKPSTPAAERPRWVKIRSMKYLKALVSGRWIVSERWLRDCAKLGRLVDERKYEAEGHLKAQHVDAACRRARELREAHLAGLEPSTADASTVGTRLFAGLRFHIHGEFLPPMPTPADLDALIRLGDGRVLPFLDDVAREMAGREDRALVIVCDKLNAAMLRRAAKELMALPQLADVPRKYVVSYQWLLTSITEARLRPLG